MSRACVSASGLAKRFGSTFALREATLEIFPGETFVIFGSNGAGKTTLLKLMAGLLRPSAGKIEFDGKPPLDQRARIGFLGHEPYLYPHLTAHENLLFLSKLYRLKGDRATRVLEQVDISHQSAAAVRTLSRGEVQRVGIARALLHDPDFLLIDEPFSGLDEETAQILPGLLRREGRTLVVTTHDLQRGEAIADRTAKLERGVLG